MVSRADLILIGTIATSSPRLTKDEKEIVTEHVINTNEVIAERGVTTSAKPGEVPRIVVDQPGGTLQLEGVTVSVLVEPMPPLKAGTRALFILRQGENGRYSIVASYGAFEVSNGRVMPLTSKKPFYQEYVGVDATAFAHELRALAARRWSGDE